MSATRCAIFLSALALLALIVSLKELLLPKTLPAIKELFTAHTRAAGRTGYASPEVAANRTGLDGSAFLRLASALVAAPPDVHYGSHQVNLLAAAYVTGGAILELGCGHFSTPLLHNVSAARGRPLLTVDHTYAWISRLRALHTRLHTFVRVHERDNYSQFGDFVASRRRWGLAFVDHGVGTRRKVELHSLSDRADLVVVHDAETAAYGYNFTEFRYRYYERHPAGELGTMVASLSRGDLVRRTRELVLLARASGI